MTQPINRSLVRIAVAIAIPLSIVLFHARPASADSFVWSNSNTSDVHSWKSVAVSADGQDMVAVADDGTKGGKIELSTDKGMTWSIVSGPVGTHHWASVAESQAGQYIIVGESNGYMYHTKDGGSTWHFDTGTNPSGNWAQISMPSDSTKAVAVNPASKSIWFDNDGAWTQNTPVGGSDWTTVAMSPDGGTIVAGANGDNLQVSTDSGSTWNGTASGKLGWTAVSAGSNGHLVAATGTISGSIYLSNNSGTTWTDTGHVGAWSSVAESADGQVIAAASNSGGYIDVSTDGGSNWSSESIPSYANWQGLALSSDGTVAAGAYDGSNIYVGTYTPYVDQSVTTDSASGFGQTSITFNGTLTTGTDPVTTRGFIYDTDPTFKNAQSIYEATGSGFSSGSFSQTVNAKNNLTCGTIYYYKAYASTAGKSINAPTSVQANTLPCDTPAPTISSPAEGSHYGSGDTIPVTFSIPVDQNTGSLTLVFTPASGKSINFNLDDVSKGTPTTISIVPNASLLVSGVKNVDQLSIPDGIYTITFTYVDKEKGPSTSASVKNIVIGTAPSTPAQAPVTVSSGGSVSGGGSYAGYVYHPGQPAGTPATPNVPAVTAFRFTRKLKLGSYDDQVKKLQRFLNTHGFQVSTSGTGSNGNESSLFGPKTKKALAAYQRSIGMKADGVLGSMTSAAIEKVLNQ